MMKFPSLSTLWDSIRSVIVRFPIQCLISLFAVVVWWLAIYSTTENLTQNYIKLLALSNLAFCLTLSADLFAETKPINVNKRWVFRIIIIIFCIVLYYSLSPQWYVRDIYRFALLIIAGHLLVSFGPFSNTKQKHAFWQYNKLLFLRILTAALYSATLFLGLLIALLSAKNLFNLSIDENIYFCLFALITAGFNTFFFLAGIPANMNYFNQDSSYPKGLKVFTQYVLIPLLTIYLLILIIYELKILIDQQLPEGMVSILILGYAVFGILSYLLTYPIRNNEGNEWMKVFSKWFFIMMIPLLVLLFIAVWVRISDYAITEPRYFLVLLSFWLSGITIYFLIAKFPNIQIVPISLCIIALFSTFGPQSASSIAKKSQLARYKSLGNEIESEKEKAAIINFMVKNYGLTSLQPLTNIDLTSIQNQIKVLKDSTSKITNQKISKTRDSSNIDSTTEISLYDTKSKLLDTAYSILKVRPQLYSLSNNFINIELDNKTINISDYNTMVDFQSHSKTDEFLNNQGKISIEYKNKDEKIIILIGEQDSTTLDLDPFFDSLREKAFNTDYSSVKMNFGNILLADSILTLTTDSKGYKLALLFKHLTIPKDKLNKDESNSNSSFNGVLLLKKNE